MLFNQEIPLITILEMLPVHFGFAIKKYEKIWTNNISNNCNEKVDQKCQEKEAKNLRNLRMKDTSGLLDCQLRK